MEQKGQATLARIRRNRNTGKPSSLKPIQPNVFLHTIKNTWNKWDKWNALVVYFRTVNDYIVETKKLYSFIAIEN